MDASAKPLTPRQVYYMLREDWPMEVGKGAHYTLHLAEKNAAGQTLHEFFIGKGLSAERAIEAERVAHATYDRKAPDLTGKLTAELVMGQLPNDWPIITDKNGLSLAPTYHDGKTLRQYLREQHHHTSIPANKMDEAIQLLTAFVAETNRDIAHIRETTIVTSRPTIVMGLPNQPPMDDRHYNPDPLAKELSFSNSFHWHKLRRSFEASGATVTLAHEGSEATNMNVTWTRNLFTLAPDNTVIFSAPPRIFENNGERPNSNRTYYTNFVHNVESLKKKFAEAGVPTRTLSGFNDGGDVVLHRQSNTAFIGITVNADGSMNEVNLKHAQEMADALGMKLAAVPKTAVFDHYYYHLDLIMMVLPDGGIVYVPGATDEIGRKAIEAAVPNPADRFELPIQGELTPTHVATNSITINGNVFGQTTPEMKTFLEGRGFKVYDGPYQVTDGGVHCETNMVQHGKADGRTDLSSLVPADMKRLAFPAAETQQATLAPTMSGRKNAAANGLG